MQSATSVISSCVRNYSTNSRKLTSCLRSSGNEGRSTSSSAGLVFSNARRTSDLSHCKVGVQRINHLVGRRYSMPIDATDHLPRGLVGPRRIFGAGSPYSTILWALLVGAFLPIPFWAYQRRYKTSWVRHVNFPVMLTGASFIPPATGINYSSWFMAAFIFRT